MRCDASSWLCGRHVSVTTAAPTRSATGPSSFFLCTKPTVFCCTDASKDSSSTCSDTARPWYNPLKRRQSNHAPDVVRHWIQTDNQQPLSSPDRFTVASYNILGDRNAFAHRDMYRNVPSHYLKWDRRKRVICDELVQWNPDIICLQEVDKYFELSEILAEVGYLGSYKRRTGDTVDGCAIFWKADKQMQKAESRRFVIGNIHVLYNPSRGEVKLGQIRFLISRAQLLSERWGNAPIVLCGDFNSTPQLNIMLYDRRELSGQRNCHPAQVLGVKQEISSPLTLIDGYSDGLAPTGVIDTVPVDVLQRIGSLPCKGGIGVALLTTNRLGRTGQLLGDESV
ncbi:hypothetical protein ACE6H2_018442 [Prunus campanulata]